MEFPAGLGEADMPCLYDREGNSYDVTQEEAESLLATGAYFTSSNPSGGHPIMTIGSLATIYDIATGEVLHRRPIDASELVATGKFSFEKPTAPASGNPKPAPVIEQEPPKQESPKQESPKQESPKQEPSKQQAGLPSLSEENSKAEITAALAEYGVQYRSNMDKADLLALWNSFTMEQTAAE